MTELDDITLLRYFEDDLPASERREVEEAIAGDPEAQKKLEMLKSSSQILETALGHLKDDLEPPQEIVKKIRLSSIRSGGINTLARRLSQANWLSIAATLLIGVGIGSFSTNFLSTKLSTSIIVEENGDLIQNGSNPAPVPAMKLPLTQKNTPASGEGISNASNAVGMPSTSSGEGISNASNAVGMPSTSSGEGISNAFNALGIPSTSSGEGISNAFQPSSSAALKLLPGISAEFRSIVIQVQTGLHAFGYYTGAFDGQFGSEMRVALIKFQELWGLNVTGTITPEVLDALAIKAE